MARRDRVVGMDNKYRIGDIVSVDANTKKRKVRAAEITIEEVNNDKRMAANKLVKRLKQKGDTNDKH